VSDDARNRTHATTTDARTMRERMLAGDPYIPDESLAAEHLLAMQRQDAFNSTPADDVALRRQRLSELLGALGAGSVIRPPIWVDYGIHIRVGARCFANFGLVALDVAPITIGDDVQIGPNVQLLPPTHPIDPAERLQRWEGGRPITIEDNVWIGGGAVVLAGVTIGRDSTVGAGAVVTRDVPPGVVVVGNPARVVREVGTVS
jgi:maltose O-acetyltransferase